MKKAVIFLFLLFSGPLLAQDQNTLFVYLKEKKILKNMNISSDSTKLFFNVQTPYAEAIKGNIDLPPLKLFLVKVKKGKMEVIPVNVDYGYDFGEDKLENIKKEVAILLGATDFQLSEPVDCLSPEMILEIEK